MLQDLAALTPPLIVCVAFLVGVVVLVRRELAPRRQARRDAVRSGASALCGSAFWTAVWDGASAGSAYLLGSIGAVRHMRVPQTMPQSALPQNAPRPCALPPGGQLHGAPGLPRPPGKPRTRMSGGVSARDLQHVGHSTSLADAGADGRSRKKTCLIAKTRPCGKKGA